MHFVTGNLQLIQNVNQTFTDMRSFRLKTKMKFMKPLLLCVAGCLILSAKAQDFSGYRTGNYTGVAGVFYNPASIAGSPFHWDVNLLSASTAIGNNKASFKISDIGRTLNSDSIKNKVFAEGSGPSSGIAS